MRNRSARIILPFFCLLLLTVVAFGADNSVPAPASPERRVTILVTATDGSGNPLQELPADKLAITDNGTSARVVDVRKADSLPLRIGFVLLGGQQNFEQQQAAAIEIARKVLRPNIDRAFVISAHKERVVTNLNLEWQNEPVAIEKAIRAIDKNVGLPDPFLFDVTFYQGTMNRMLPLLVYGQEGGKSVFDVIWMMMKSDPTPARHMVVTFRDAWAHSPGTGSASMEYTAAVENNHIHLITDAQKAWTPFYVVGFEQSAVAPSGLTRTYSPTFSGQGQYDRQRDEAIDRFKETAYNAGKANVGRLAQETGGKVWWSSKKNYSDAVSGIVNLVNGQYAVTYAVPAPPSVPPEHTLEVRTTASGARVNVQKMYYSRVGPASQQPAAEASGTGGARTVR